MADKTTKKTTAKKTVTKTVAAKKTTVKKATIKKAPAKKVMAPAADKFPCGCDKGCACGGDCVCAKKKCTLGRFLKKLILVLIIFALGFASAKMCCCHKRAKMGPRPMFENGCLVVKCEKMAEKVAMMDTNADGCVTREEFKAAHKHMKRAPHDVAEQPVAAEPAPDMPEMED